MIIRILNLASVYLTPLSQPHTDLINVISKESSTEKIHKQCNLTKPYDVEAGAVLHILKGNLDVQHQTKVWMLPLGESTRESKVSGQGNQKEDSKRVKGRRGKVDGTVMMWTHSVRKC
jgi:hypothetical protein